MPTYKNISKSVQKFRAGEGGKKKVYKVAPGKTVNIPVEISHGAMQLENEEMTKRKKNKGDE